MSKGGSKTTTVQNNDPWKPAQPYLKQGLGDLAQWYSSDYNRQPYPGSTVVPFHPLTEQALGQTATRAQAGSDLTRAAQDQTMKTARGDYLPGGVNQNPFLGQTFDLAAGKIRSALDSQFNRSGGYGGSMHQGAMASNLNDLGTQIYGGAYDQERNRQIQANLFAPNLAQQDYFDSAQLANVGSAYEQQARNYIQDQQARWDFYNQSPYQRLQQYFGIANPTASQGGTQTQTTPNNSNPLSTILGVGATIAGLPIF